MKELSTEEKAKAYDEAIKRAKELQHDNCWVTSIFPELKESEDERIIERIKKAVESYWSDESLDEILGWLEKQGEQNQKHFELKAGHWYICHRAFCCRADHLTVKEGERFMCEKDGVVKGFVFKEPEKYFKEVCPPAPMEDEQKPAWSEDDEETYYGVIETEQYMLDVVNGIKKFDVGNISIKEECTRELNWLKSFKDRMQALS